MATFAGVQPRMDLKAKERGGTSQHLFWTVGNERDIRHRDSCLRIPGRVGGVRVILTLPYPISSNRYWRSARGRVFVSAEAKAYKQEVALIARTAGMREPASISSIALIVKLIPKNRICMDLDNALKVTIDALKGIAFEDDSQVVKIQAEKLPPDGIGRLLIEVQSMGVE